MRIYIETDMNEMPKSCSECKRIERSKTMSNLGYCKDAESFRHWKDAHFFYLTPFTILINLILSGCWLVYDVYVIQISSNPFCSTP